VKLWLQGRAPRLPQAPLWLLNRLIAPIGGGKLQFGGYLGFSMLLSCGRKFSLYAALYIGVFRYDRSQQGLQHFPSLHRTLSHEDSEEIGKGINAVLNERLNGYDNGFGSG
jgi:hypothetical protein